MGALTLPIDFLAHASDSPRSGEFAGIVEAAR